MQPSRKILLVLGCLAVCVLPGPAGAQPHEPAGQGVGGPQTVRVVLVGPEPSSSFLYRLQSWFESETTVVLSGQPALLADRVLGPQPKRGVHVWIDLRSAGSARVYLVASRQDDQRFLVRGVELEGGLDEVGHERLAQVVYASVLAVWEGRAESPRAQIEHYLAAAAEPEPSPEPEPLRNEPAGPPVRPTAQQGQEPAARRPQARAPPHAPPRAPNSSFAYSLGAAYGAGARGDEGLAHGPGIRGTLLAGAGPTRIGTFLSVQYVVPVDVSTDDVALELTGGRLRLGAVLRHQALEVLDLEAGLGPGLDVVRYDVTTQGSLNAAHGETEARPVLSGYVGSRWRVGRGRIVLLAGVDTHLQKTHYDVDRAGDLDPILTPWLVQPGAVLLFCIDWPRP